MDFFKKILNKPTPKEVAKERLKLILINDRGNIPQEILEKIRIEILEVISKYIEIDTNDVEIAVNQLVSSYGNNPALTASIPIKNIR